MLDSSLAPQEDKPVERTPANPLSRADSGWCCFVLSVIVPMLTIKLFYTILCSCRLKKWKMHHLMSATECLEGGMHLRASFTLQRCYEMMNNHWATVSVTVLILRRHLEQCNVFKYRCMVMNETCREIGHQTYLQCMFSDALKGHSNNNSTNNFL